ncbi:hypothetical protein [Cellulomonas hominis]
MTDSAHTTPARWLMTRVVAPVTVLTLGLGLGWVAADRFQSPEQRQAAAQAPSPGPVTAEVISGVLSETVSSQASITRQSRRSVRIVLPGADAVVTAEPAAVGSAVGAGTEVLTVNARPVFVLPGAFPFFRDLGTGDTGPDVAQLQEALRAAGHPIPARESSTFGPATVVAVRAMYAAAGYAPALEPVETDTSGDATTAAAGRSPVTLVSTRSGSAAPAPTPGPTVPTCPCSSDPADDPAPGPDPGTEVDPPDGPAPADPPAAEPPRTTAPLPAPRLVVPRAETLVVTRLPAVLASVPSTGTVLDPATALVELEDGAVVAQAPVATGVAVRVEPGQSGRLRAADGAELAVVVQAVTPATQDGEQATVTLHATTGEIQGEWIGQTLLVVIEIRTVGQESLIVPTRAVATGGAGDGHVLRREADGSFRSVAVTELGALGGQSAIAPTEPGTLAAGDEVRVG